MEQLGIFSIFIYIYIETGTYLYIKHHVEIFMCICDVLTDGSISIFFQIQKRFNFLGGIFSKLGIPEDLKPQNS